MVTPKYEIGRQVEKEKLNSYNLKTDNNLNDYVLIIISAENDRLLFENLEYIVKPIYINSFNNVEDSLRFISSQHDVDVFVIISGQLGRQFASKFIDIPQIVGVYVYCMNENEHKIWTKEFTNIRCTVSNQEELLKELHRGIKELSGRWPLDERSFQKAAISISDWYHLFLTVICYRPQCIRESYEEMFKESYEYYRNDSSRRKQIDRFRQTYTSNEAIHEYTKDGFIYRIVNHALRTKNIEIVQKFSPIIRDINSQIHDIHREYHKLKNYIRVAYRGQYLSKNELEYLRSISKSNTTVITTTTFTSTSLDPDVALDFIPSVNGRISCLFEIIIPDSLNINQDYQQKYKQAFANIASISALPGEQEVLFSLMTHFSVRYVGYEMHESEHTWVPIQLELINEEEAQRIIGYFMIREWLEKQTDQNIDSEVVDMLQQINAEDQSKFKSRNWQIWWNNLKRNCGKGIGEEQPLNLIFYDCFTDDLSWSRKAIDLHKHFLRTYRPIQSNLSCFQLLYREFKVWHTRPTISIAIYEDYLEQFCNEDSEEVIQCLCSVGDHYRNISDHQRARECYEKASQLNVNDKYKKDKHIQKQITEAQKSLKEQAKIDNPKRQSMIQKSNQNIPEKYQYQQDLQLLYEPINSQNMTQSPTIKRLRQILRYIDIRETWYDITDSRILLRLPYETNDDLSVKDYRLYFLSAVHAHISSGSFKKDAANNYLLSLERYGRYISEWTLCKELERFFQRFKNKLRFIRENILPRLERLIKKLLVLITIVIVYMSIEKITGNVNVDTILTINRTNPTMTHPISTDLHDSHLITALEKMEDEHSGINETSYIIPDDKKFPPSNKALADFIENMS